MSVFSLDLVEALAPSSSALENARSLLKQGALEGRTRTADGSLIFARCRGSGKEPYFVSADLSRAEKPLPRCSCPSRQSPCKHGIALMLAYAGGERFEAGEAPPELLAKREQAERRERKAAAGGDSEAVERPKKTDIGALRKKIEAQILGLEALDETTRRIGAGGIGTITPEGLEALEAQAKRLGDVFLPGPQVLLRRFAKDAGSGEEGRGRAVDELCLLRALARKGLERCRERLADPGLALDPASTMDEWLGHVWQLSELEAAGLVRTDAELVQLSFAVYDDAVKGEYSESGLWADLADGRVLETRNLRPYKALKHIKATDSFFKVAKIPKLCVYPGGLNPRARWDGSADREPTPADFAGLLSLARPSIAEACDAARAQMKNALLPPCPALLLRFEAIGAIGTETVLVDSAGDRIALRDGGGYPVATTRLVGLAPGDFLADGALLARFFREGEDLFVQPISIVGAKGILRLAW